MATSSVKMTKWYIDILLSFQILLLLLLLLLNPETFKVRKCVVYKNWPAEILYIRVEESCRCI